MAGRGRNRFRRGSAVAERPLVRHDDHEVGRGPRARQHATDGGRAVAEREPPHVPRGRVRRRGPQREADRGDLQAPALDQGPGRGPVGPGCASRVGDVGGEKAVLRPRHPGPQRVDRPVELVVADCGPVDAERIHRCDGREAEAEVREERPLHFVAAVQADGGAAARPRERVQPRLQRRGAADQLAIGPRPRARFEGAVEVVDGQHPQHGAIWLAHRRRRRRDDDVVGGIGSGGWGGDNRMLRRDEQREEHAHSAL